MTAALEKPFIKSPFTEKLFAKMDRLRIQKTKYGDVRCLAITGESGSGKSELAFRYALKHPVKESRFRTEIPVLLVELQSVLSPKDLIVQILIAIRDPQNGEGEKNINGLIDRFARLSKEVGLELIMLDEVQTTIQRRSYRVLAGIADKIKDLIIQARIPIVFFGMPWSTQLFDANRQLSERISTRIVIEPYILSEENSLENYKKLVNFLFSHYRIPKKLDIPFMEVLLRLFAYTSGNMRRTVELIRDVYVESDLTERNISIELFSRVLRGYGFSDRENPFILPFGGLKLFEMARHSDWDSTARAGASSIIQPQYIGYGVSSDFKLFKLAPV